MSETNKIENSDVKSTESLTTRSGRRQKPVYVYLTALFVVALLLMSLSFLMSHRSNQQVMGALQENVNSLQLLQEAQDRNAELLQRVNSLEDEISAQRDEIFQLEQELYTLQKQLVEARQQLSAGEGETDATEDAVEG